jgi:hypothetical protein
MGLCFNLRLEAQGEAVEGRNIAAPFALGTWKAKPIKGVWVPLTEQRRHELERELKWQVNDCKDENAIERQHLPQLDCELTSKPLEEGREQVYHEDQFKYWAINLVVPLVVFVGIFGLAMVVPAIALRYWRWLKT